MIILLRNGSDINLFEPITVKKLGEDLIITDGHTRTCYLIENGLGKSLVKELLIRMKGKAKFATVSGDCNNASNPINLYKKCGFIGNSIWYIAYE